MRTTDVLVSTFLVFGCTSGSAPPKTQAEAPRAESAESARPSESAGPSVVNEPPDRLAVEQVQKAISEVAPRVKAECWQPALDRRRSDDPTDVRVHVIVVVNPSGGVDSADAENVPEAYPSLPGCIETVLRNARFPQAVKSTRLTVPFVFAAK